MPNRYDTISPKGRRESTMEKFILGLLMVYSYTAYELHVLIKNNYQGICSHSIGNIQRALKKLAEAGSVTSVSVVDNEVNKKIYTITPEGRKVFLEWLDHPLEIQKSKNMEVSRLLLMGFLDDEQQMARIEEAIEETKKEYEYLLAIKEAHEEGLKRFSQFESNEALTKAYLAQVGKRVGEEFINELVQSSPVDSFQETLVRVNKFGELTLQFGLNECEFILNWLIKLKKILEDDQRK